MTKYWDDLQRLTTMYQDEVLPPYTLWEWKDDPKGLLFRLSRYKFCAKLLDGKQNAAEIGCGDAFCVPILLQNIKKITCFDIDKNLIEDNKKRYASIDNISFEEFDFTLRPREERKKEREKEKFDCAICLDVIEHIKPNAELRFLQNIIFSLTKDAVLIIGTPNITASEYASPVSKQEHINLKSHDSLRTVMSTFFDNVFLFSMNDEVVHTGFYPMGHYLFSVGVGKRNI